MKIGLRGGHSPNCKGAMGYLDEQVEVRKIYTELEPMLKKAGHTVINCNSDASNVNSELNEGTNKANSNNCDIFMSLHMNASNGAGNGVECLLYDNTNATMVSIGNKICSNLQAKGYQNRGVKYFQGYHDLNATIMPAMIVESLFCDNKKDTDLYKTIGGAKGVAALIFNAITGETADTSGGSSTTPTPTTPTKKEDGHNVHLYENNGNPYQKWDIIKEGEYYRFKNKKTGEYMDTAGVAKSGINLKTYKKSTSAGQLFKIIPVKDSTTNTECYVISSKANANLVVDVNGAGVANSTNIQLYTRNNTKAQMWYFRKDSDGYMIFNIFSLKALDGGGSL